MSTSELFQALVAGLGEAAAQVSPGGVLPAALDRRVDWMMEACAQLVEERLPAVLAPAAARFGPVHDSAALMAGLSTLAELLGVQSSA